MKWTILLACVPYFFSATLFGATKVSVSAYEFPPYISDGRNEPGYLREIVEKVFKKAGYDPTFQFLPPARAFKLAETGVTEVIVPVYKTSDTENVFEFSTPLKGSSLSLVTLKATTGALSALDDQKAYIAKSNIGYLTSDHIENALSSLKSKKLEPIQTMIQLVDMLSKKRVDGVLVDKEILADYLINQRPTLINEIAISSPTIIQNDFYLGFSKAAKNSGELKAKFQKALDGFVKSTEYQEILTRYGLQEVTQDPNTITIASVINPDMQLMRELSSNYTKKNPKVKFNWYFMEENVLRRRILSSLLTGEKLFDTIFVGSIDTIDYAKRGWLSPFEEFPATYEKDDLIKPVIDRLKYQNKIYSLPFYGESTMTYYRKDLFEKASLKMPEKPTYAELLTFAKKLHNPDKNIYGICLRGKPGWGENLATLSHIVHTSGGAFFDEKWQPAINTPEWKQSVELYKELMAYGPKTSMSNGYMENFNLMKSGSCAQWMDATVAIAWLMDKKTSKVADTIAYTDSPYVKYTGGSRLFWAWAFAIPKSAPNQALAQDFVMWATSKDYINLVGQSRQWLTVPPGTRYSTYQNAAYKKAAPFSDFVLNQIEHLEPLPTNMKRPYEDFRYVIIPEFTAVGNIIADKLYRMQKEELTIDKGLTEAQNEVKAIMNTAGYYK